MDILDMPLVYWSSKMYVWIETLYFPSGIMKKFKYVLKGNSVVKTNISSYTYLHFYFVRHEWTTYNNVILIAMK